MVPCGRLTSVCMCHAPCAWGPPASLPAGFVVFLGPRLLPLPIHTLTCSSAYCARRACFAMYRADHGHGCCMYDVFCEQCDDDDDVDSHSLRADLCCTLTQPPGSGLTWLPGSGRGGAIQIRIPAMTTMTTMNDDDDRLSRHSVSATAYATANPACSPAH